MNRMISTEVWLRKPPGKGIWKVPGLASKMRIKTHTSRVMVKRRRWVTPQTNPKAARTRTGTPRTVVKKRQWTAGRGPLLACHLEAMGRTNSLKVAINQGRQANMLKTARVRLAWMLAASSRRVSLPGRYRRPSHQARSRVPRKMTTR